MAETEKKSKPKHSHQGPLNLWHGMSLKPMFKLLAKRPPMHWSRAHKIALLGPMCTYNSCMSLVEDLIFARKVKQTEVKQPPLFIIGFWRSGTTWLHNLMTRDPRVAFPNSYQMLFPQHFLLTGLYAPQMTAFMLPKTRPMDNVRFGWDLPQEDEFALATMTLLSPYIVTACPDDFSKHADSFDFDGAPPEQVQLWKDSLELIIRKLTYKTGKPLVMKSPGHTLRIPYLLDLYPDAKFLYIYRNPYNVFNSVVHMRKTMCVENEFGRSKLLGHEEEALRTLELGYRVYERDSKLIPEGNLHELRFESLEADPLGEVEKAYAALDLGDFGPAREVLAPEVAGMKRYKKNRFDQDSEWMDRVYDTCNDAFKRYGYDRPQTGAPAGPPSSSASSDPVATVGS